MKKLLTVFLFSVSLIGAHASFAADGVVDQTQASQGKDSGANIANIIAALALLPMCIGPPPNPMACAMMAMALMQAGADGQHEGSAAATEGTASPRFGISDSENPNEYDPNSGSVLDAEGVTGEDGKRTAGGSGLTPTQERQLKQAQDILAQEGYGIDGSGTVTTPDGNKFPSSAFSSPSGLKALGASDKEVADATKASDLANNALKDYKLKGGGGGGGGGKAAMIPLPEIEPFDPSKFGFNTASANVPKGNGNPYYGFSRTFGTDQIGVAGDNIFDMIHRRYTAKKRARSFIMERVRTAGE